MSPMGRCMLKAYATLTSVLAPLITLWLWVRRLSGKEDPKRMRERFGFASRPRPAGALLWLHAASVGEANSVLPLIDQLRERFPMFNILLTTGTVTSAQLMARRLPKDVIHQYVPVDTPQATARFMRHWMPDFAFWVESEFWPNLVLEANRSQCFMGVINARMSDRSFKSWDKYPALISAIIGAFDCVFAQSDKDATRFRALGARQVTNTGNLKYDALMLTCDEGELIRLTSAIGARPVWLAASTHPGEEEMIASAHTAIAAKHPGLLTIIAPRHPNRGPEITAALAKYRVGVRSRKDAIAPDSEIYIADTLGELGLFYRLSETVFMGGSLVKHGGQNPLEPARLSCAIVTGPYVHNFADIYQEMEKTGAAITVKNADALAAKNHLTARRFNGGQRPAE